MSQLDIKAVEINFEGWRKERTPELSISNAFERYAIELILRDADLSDDELSSGWMGGGGDGGIDGMYMFVNRRLMVDEAKLPDQVMSVELHIIQAKYEASFGETPVQRMQMFIDDMLDYTKPVEAMTYYNQKVKDAVSRFRERYEAIIGQPHTMAVKFWYATKSDDAPHPNVLKREENLKAKVNEHVSSATSSFEFWGAKQLTAAFRNPPNRTLSLDIVKHLMSDDGSVVCLARLDKFAAFLTDERGALREYLLEPNVRDYQGARNPVNRAIKDALQSSEVQEFWWLNNGITILADKCGVAAGKVEIVSPELVNGLQTSHELFNYFSSHKGDETRMVLVRVILPPNDQIRRRIIKATNNQTPVDPLSLRATEDIHFDIEELLKLYGIFYDRRKGEYRRLRKPISKIISIKDLAQAVIAVALRRPNDARARPMSQLGTEQGYVDVFDVKANREMFLACILLDRQVDAYLAGRTDLTKDTKNDIQFYMDTWLAAHLTSKPEPSKADIAAMAASVKAALPAELLSSACDAIMKIYHAHGADAKAAKGTGMTDMLLSDLKGELHFGKLP